MASKNAGGAPGARARKLKVFRTPIGFHDAYVAAASQKAALAAWGADSNLFASGSAEQVTDEDLMRAPLAHPGQVIRRPRGTPEEHMAALPVRAKTGRPRVSADREAGENAVPPPSRPRPRPKRDALDRAEAALAELERSQRGAQAEMARRQAELDRARWALEVEQQRERARLRGRVDAAREKYERAMEAWRSG